MDKKIFIAILLAISCSNLFGQELEKTKTKIEEVEYIRDSVKNRSSDFFTMLFFLFPSSLEELDYKMRKHNLDFLNKEEIGYFCNSKNLIVESVEKYDEYNFIVSLDTMSNFYRLLAGDMKRYNSCNLFVFIDTTSYSFSETGVKKFAFRSLLVKKKNDSKSGKRTISIQEFSYIHTKYYEFPKYTILVFKKKKKK